MKRVVMLAIFGVLSAAYAAAQDNAVVMAVGGKCSVVSGGAVAEAGIGTRLKAGDTVKAAGGDVKIFLSTGKMENVKDGAEYTLPAGTVKPAEAGFGARVVAALGEMLVKGEDPAVAGMVRGPSEIELSYPCNTAVAAGDLKFKWELKEGVQNLVLMVRSERPGFKRDISMKQGTLEMEYPGEGEKLQENTKYYWKVREVESRNIPPAESRCSWFATAGDDTIKKLAAEIDVIDKSPGMADREKVILKAALAVSYGLKARAAAVLAGYHKVHSDDAGIKKIIDFLNREMSQPVEGN